MTLCYLRIGPGIQKFPEFIFTTCVNFVVNIAIEP